MPKIGKSKNKDTKKVLNKIVCQNTDCAKSGKEQPNTNFYNTNSKILPKYPVCKTCLKNMIVSDDLQTVCKVLKEMNMAFIKDLWEKSCLNTPDNPFGNYVRQMNSLPQYKGYTWSESRTESTSNNSSTSFYESEVDINITSDILLRWGKNYSKEDYIVLEDFYHRMKDANKIETPQDESYLKKLSIISLKMDKELEDGNYSQAKSLGDLFSKYMADSQFRAMDKTDADKTGGLRNFGTIYAEVESDDFIPPWEKYRKLKGIKQDIVDKTIMFMSNFTLKLNKIESMSTPPLDTPKLESDEED